MGGSLEPRMTTLSRFFRSTEITAALTLNFRKYQLTCLSCPVMMSCGGKGVPHNRNAVSEISPSGENASNLAPEYRAVLLSRRGPTPPIIPAWAKVDTLLVPDIPTQYSTPPSRLTGLVKSTCNLWRHPIEFVPSVSSIVTVSMNSVRRPR